MILKSQRHIFWDQDRKLTLVIDYDEESKQVRFTRVDDSHGEGGLCNGWIWHSRRFSGVPGAQILDYDLQLTLLDSMKWPIATFLRLWSGWPNG